MHWCRVYMKLTTAITTVCIIIIILLLIYFQIIVGVIKYVIRYHNLNTLQGDGE